MRYGYFFACILNQLIWILLTNTSILTSYKEVLPQYMRVTSWVSDVSLWRLRLDKVFDCHKERARDSFVSSSSELVVLLEMHVKVLFEYLVSDEPHPTYRALEFDWLVDFWDDIWIRSIVKG